MDLGPIAGHQPTRISDQLQAAAVLVPIIYRDDVPYLLFTKRAEHLGEHAGQMSFPGGGREPDDETLFATATREAKEEIGLQPTEVEPIGQLDDIRTVTNYAVTPFVGKIPDRSYLPDEQEVAEVTVLPVSALIDPTNYESEQRDHPYYGDIIVHYFHVDGYTVWGATARILVQLLEFTTDWRPPNRTNRTLNTESES